jgi:hypothetical protein
MLLIRTHQRASSTDPNDVTPTHPALPTDHLETPMEQPASSLDETVRAWHAEGRSPRSIARDLNIDRRKVKQIIDQEAALFLKLDEGFRAVARRGTLRLHGLTVIY